MRLLLSDWKSCCAFVAWALFVARASFVSLSSVPVLRFGACFSPQGSSAELPRWHRAVQLFRAFLKCQCVTALIHHSIAQLTAGCRAGDRAADSGCWKEEGGSFGSLLATRRQEVPPKAFPKLCLDKFWHLWSKCLRRRGCSISGCCGHPRAGSGAEGKALLHSLGGCSLGTSALCRQGGASLKARKLPRALWVTRSSQNRFLFPTIYK